MKRYMNVILKDIEGVEMVEYPNAIKQGEEPTPVPITIGKIVVNALLASFDDERQLSGDEKARRFRLAQNVYEARKGDGWVDLTAEDITLLKALVGKGYGPLIVGQIYDILENE